MSTAGFSLPAELLMMLRFRYAGRALVQQASGKVGVSLTFCSQGRLAVRADETGSMLCRQRRGLEGVYKQARL